jgi:hypothetical protein
MAELQQLCTPCREMEARCAVRKQLTYVENPAG